MHDPDYYNRYYEEIHANKRKLTITEERRINTTINLIPDDIESLLDVGCGDGRIVNRLQGKYEKICGMDISSNALKNVKTTKVQGSLEKLPFPDNSFDITICAEVLEHLPYPIYNKAIKELERVSKQYILISVPNKENLDIRMIKCPQCGCLSNEWRHLRSFDKEKIKNLFKNFQIEKTKNLLTEEFLFSNTIIKIGKCLNINKQFPKTAVCPQCGYSPKYENESKSNNLKTNGIGFFKKILPLRKTNFWIVALYKCSKGKNDL